MHIIPFGVIPKRNKPGKWRLILDLSSPDNYSVNEGISKELCSLSYTSIDEIVKRIIQLGQGALLAKVNIKQAYRNVPVHPEDRLLLGMSWKQTVYVNMTLPFGLRSAPIIFSAVADGLQWIIEQEGVQSLFHYLDDFITVGMPGSSECATNLRLIKQCCEDTGTPLEADKAEGPTTHLTFLGMELDSMAMQMKLPDEKLMSLRRLTNEWKGRKAGKKRELLSLIGSLNHACKAIRQGRSFLRRLIDLASSVRRLDHYVRLNLSAQSDIHWWHEFAACWNGVSMLSQLKRDSPDIQLISDASGSWGCGVFSGTQWFQL